MLYVAVDVGCIECGECTSVLGVFAKEEDAQRALDEAKADQKTRWTGEHSFELHVVTEITQ